MKMETFYSLEARKPESSEKSPASAQCEGCFAASLCSRRHVRQLKSLTLLIKQQMPSLRPFSHDLLSSNYSLEVLSP